ncbi:MAG: type II toxin-antitoxin system VapC family toxin, partial [Spartobacteria bacterium]
MRILIDTHALIWFCEGNTNLSDKARKAMQDDAIEKFISPAVPWEMAIKISIGKLTLKTDFSSLFPGVVSANGFHILALHFSHFEYLAKFGSIVTIEQSSERAWAIMILSKGSVWCFG